MLVECEICKQKFEIGSDETIIHKKEYEVNEQSIFLTYYDCPSCGRRHYVQVDDETSLKILEETKAQFIKLAIKRRWNKKIPKKQSDKFKKTQKYLANYRINLMKKYTDKLIYDSDTKSKFVLRFSIWKN